MNDKNCKQCLLRSLVKVVITYSYYLFWKFTLKRHFLLYSTKQSHFARQILTITRTLDNHKCSAPEVLLSYDFIKILKISFIDICIKIIKIYLFIYLI